MGYTQKCQDRLTLHTAHFAIVACCALLSGCWPYHYTMQPGVSGVVVAAPGADPLAGAQVTLSIQQRGIPPTFTETSTDVQGRFRLVPHRQWGVFIPMQEPFIPTKCAVLVTAPRFVMISRDVRCSPMGPATTDLGTITLERAP